MRKFRFSLIELFVIISMIATLAAMMLPSLSRAKEYAYDVSCKNNLRNIGIGTKNYMLDNKNKYPSPEYWLSDFTPSYGYTNSLKIYICPKSTTKIRSASDLNGGTDYYTYGTVSDYDQDNGLGNSPYKIDMSNPGNVPTMIAFLSALTRIKHCIYENMRGENTNPKRNHLGYFNYILIDNLRLEKEKNLSGFFWLNHDGDFVDIGTGSSVYKYTY